jgi:ribose-phosphate pyrophosphokinase
MRQDKAFTPGEGVTSRYFAELLSENFDWLTTVDPHLHRWSSLNQIYSIPTELIHAGKPITEWIKQNVNQPLIIGPDQESEQWIAAIAQSINAPYVIAQKTRNGDRDVSVSIPQLEKYPQHSPVLIDDIISTGKTLLSAIQILQKAKMPAPICIGIHAVFAGDAYTELLKSGIQEVITCNTIHHPSNGIDLNSAIADIVKKSIEL